MLAVPESRQEAARSSSSGGASSEDVARVGFYLGFIPSWLRPIENQLVTNRPEDVHALPEHAKRLLDVSEGGFTVYA